MTVAFGRCLNRSNFSTNDKETIIFERIFMLEYFILELGCSNSEKSVKMGSKQQAYTHVVKST